jgi:phosphate transport system substrate-binding protein
MLDCDWSSDVCSSDLATLAWTQAVLCADPAAADPLAAFAGQQGKIDIAGGTAHIPVMKDAAQRIMQANPKINITVAGGGSGVGVQKVGEGLVEIGNTGRALSADEVARYGLKSYAFALDGVAVVAHPRNPVAGLTAQQARDIFAGKTKNWSEVGGAEGAIHVFTRDEASGTREVFWEKLLQKGAIVDAANVVASNGAMKTAVAQDPLAIGYVSIGHLDAGLRALAIDGVEPSQDNALSGRYPVVRKLYMNTKGEPGGLVKAFIDYILGGQGAELVRKSGYLPLQ